MNSTPKDPARSITPEGEPDQDARAIVQILDEYLARLESGEPMDREELLAAHPELADQLSSRLDALDFMHGVAPQLADGTTSDSAWPTDLPLKCLGDFRLLREIGRGGMGVVYEAEQESLGRHVALKVLPFAALMDSRQLQRFKNEARAAATLHHANIVPVYSVGFERGIHYFAMQLIEGSSLETILRQLRQPKAEITTDTTNANQQTEQNDAQSSTSVDTVSISALATAYSLDRNSYFRQAARLAIDAAEALDHAHSLGIVHRDIKPANLLIDMDGRLWVSDFGLARLESDAGMTMSGDVMGTLRYMSSEQAQGKRHVIDPRTDIYSLGATLYELLTLQPVFTAQDRPQLMRQITEQEPRLLRSIDRGIPPDLETIVLKTLQKSPDDRYASAQELADDLRRFLEEKSIEAKRPTRIARAIRWSRRHIETLSAVAIALIIALVIATALVTSAYRGEMRQRVIAEKQRVIAEKQRERAEEHLQLARTVVDTMYTRFADEWLRNDISMTDLQKEYVQRAAEFYDQLSDQEMGDPAMQLSMAEAKIRLAVLYARMGDDKQRSVSEANLVEALAILKQIPPPSSESTRCRYTLAWCHFELQKSKRADQGHSQYKLAHLRTARQIITAVLEKEPSDDRARSLLSAVMGNMGMVRVFRGELEEAKRLLFDARQVAEQIADEAQRYQVVAACNSRLGRLPSAYLSDEEKDEVLRQAVEAARALHAKAARNPLNLVTLSGALNNLAAFRLDHRDGSVEDVVPLFEESATILMEIMKQAPEMSGVEHNMVRTSGNMDYAAAKLKADASVWRRVIGVQQRVLDACIHERERPGVFEQLARSHAGLANGLVETGQLNEALKVADQFQELMTRRNLLVTQDQWPSYALAQVHLRFCSLFAKEQRRVEAYQHCLAAARHSTGVAKAAYGKDFDESRLRDRLLDCFLTTYKAYGYVFGEWGSESLMEACRDAVSRNEYGKDELWLLQAMADGGIGNYDQALQRMTPVFEQENMLPAEALLYVLGLWLALTDVEHPDDMIRLVETLVGMREARIEGEEVVWQVPVLGAMAHGGLAGAYRKRGDWPRVAEHGQVAVQLVEKSLQQGVVDFRGNDVRGLGSDNAMECANAYFQLREFDLSKQMASLAVQRIGEMLADKPHDEGQRRKLARSLFQLAEAEYFAGRNEDAHRAYDQSLQSLREVLAIGATDHELEDRRKLCGMLTRNPFLSSAPTKEAQEMSQRLLDLAPDDPAVWHELAWVDYYTGNLEAAQTWFLKFLEASEGDDEPKRIALTGCALAEHGLGHEDAAREYFRQAVEAFEQAPDVTVFGMHEHSTLMEVAKRLGQGAVVDRIFVTD